MQVTRFHDLIPYRVREILLVSSPYDAFILEEDGRLSDQVYNDFRALELSAPPRFHHASSSHEALRRLQQTRFDLILVMSSLVGDSINRFSAAVRELYPGKPIVYLALDPRELEDAERSLDPTVVDRSFLWTGDSSVLLGLIKSVEDRLNTPQDTAAGVRVILVLEDSPRFYSTFLGLLYEELMTQAKSLYFEGLTELQRRVYIRSRPKILLATSYEEGVELVDRYRDRLVALIGDIGIPRNGSLDERAGLDFARRLKDSLPDLPMLLHSAEPENAAAAEELGVLFFDKGSRKIVRTVKSFLAEQLGFGSFVFRLPDGTEVARAADVRELSERLEEVPLESIEFHAAHDHFSIWLMARSEFALAEQLRPKKISDFPDVEALRRHLIDNLRATRYRDRRGIVTEFADGETDVGPFSRVGEGSLGAKARGLAFLHQRLHREDLPQIGPLPVRVPRTVTLTTEVFDAFVDDDLVAWAIACDDDNAIDRRFVERPMPAGVERTLDAIAEQFDGPLAVRSSSLLEDSAHRPFAGVYATLMIPNCSTPQQRREELSEAVRRVWASTYYRDACSYRESTGAPTEREKMAVMIQELIGGRHGDRFYPAVSGVALTRNFYPIGPQRPEDGVVHLALGLGRMIVDGGLSLRFSPRHPGVLPQTAAPRVALRSTQRHFYGVALSGDGTVDPMDAVQRFELGDAEDDGVLELVGSVALPDEERLVEDLSRQGPRLVTFHNILKHRSLPLVETLAQLMALARRGLGRHVEIEFAVHATSPAGGVWCNPELVALQVRPMTARPTTASPPALEFREEDLLCRCSNALGHGVEKAIRDVIYVKPKTWEASRNRTIAGEIGKLNRSLHAAGRPFLLIGPGRWGSSDEWLGIPVQWSQIAGVRAIVEASPAQYQVEPSQGTHFFQNITSLRIGYFTMPPGSVGKAQSGDFLDLDWLDGRDAEAETAFVRHVSLEEPLTTVLRGREGEGWIVKPGAEAVG